MKALVFQHVDVEHPGSFLPLWRRDGIDWTVVELDAGEQIPGDLASYDALIVMGGPQDVWQESVYPWLLAEKAAIAHFVLELRRPFLGICLGHQLLAEAIGGSVSLMHEPEVGVVDVELTEAAKSDRLFQGLSSPLKALQWHSAEVRQLPEGAVILASNRHCPIQAFRFGEAAYGIQFHVEIKPDTVAEWRAIPPYAAALETVLGPKGAEVLAIRTTEMIEEFHSTAITMHQNFLGALAKSLPGRIDVGNASPRAS